MADTKQTAALIVVAQEYRGDIVAQINRRATALRLLRIVPGMGQNVAEVAEGDGAVAESYADGDDASNFGSDAQKAALWKWGLYRANFHITDLARQIAESSPTPTGVRNLLGRNLKNGIRALCDKVNKELHSGTGTNNLIAGFGEALKDDNTYAGIDRTSETYWQSNVFDPGASTAPTFAQIRSDLGAIYDASGETPDIAFCSTAVFNTIGNLFTETRRYVQEVSTARGAIRLDAGYAGIEIDGCVFVKDKDAIANSIEYVNTNYVEIEYLPLPRSVQAQLDAMGIEMPADDGYGALPLGVWCEQLAKTGSSSKYQCKTTLALKVAKPNACGIRKNVATS